MRAIGACWRAPDINDTIDISESNEAKQLLKCTIRMTNSIKDV